MGFLTLCLLNCVIFSYNYANFIKELLKLLKPTIMSSTVFTKERVMVHIFILKNAVHNPTLRLLHGLVLLKSFSRNWQRPSFCVKFRKMVVLCYAIILAFSPNVKPDDYPLSAVDSYPTYSQLFSVFRYPHPQKAPCRSWRPPCSDFSVDRP